MESSKSSDKTNIPNSSNNTKNHFTSKLNNQTISERLNSTDISLANTERQHNNYETSNNLPIKTQPKKGRSTPFNQLSSGGPGKDKRCKKGIKSKKNSCPYGRSEFESAPRDAKQIEGNTTKTTKKVSKSRRPSASTTAEEFASNIKDKKDEKYYKIPKQSRTSPSTSCAINMGHHRSCISLSHKITTSELCEYNSMLHRASNISQTKDCQENNKIILSRDKTSGRLKRKIPEFKPDHGDISMKIDTSSGSLNRSNSIKNPGNNSRNKRRADSTIKSSKIKHPRLTTSNSGISSSAQDRPVILQALETALNTYDELNHSEDSFDSNSPDANPKKFSPANPIKDPSQFISDEDYVFIPSSSSEHESDYIKVDLNTPASVSSLTTVRRTEIDCMSRAGDIGSEYLIQLHARNYLQCGENTLIYVCVYALADNDYKYLNEIELLYPRDIGPNDLLLLHDNFNVYQLYVDLRKLFAMYSGELMHVSNTIKLPENVGDVLRSSLTRKHEYHFTDSQMDVVTTPNTHGGSGTTIPTDTTKSSAGKRLSLAELKKRAREMKSAVKDITIEIYDPYDKSVNSKNLKRKPTGLITNIKESKNHYCLWDPNYPENPFRLSCVLDRFHEYGLYERCEILTPRPATKEEILVAHSERVHNLLETYASPDIGEDDFEALSSKFDAIFINDTTECAAKFAAGCCVELVDAIMSNKVQNGFAVIRPPGHHAMHNEYNGYCFFNNAVISANYAINKYAVKRILIVDFDVHHGQGIQDHFYKSKSVLYFSIHRYEFGTFWPNLRRSDYDYIGEADGEGFNFNVPLNETGMTDVDYLTVFNTVLMPVAYEYDPELVIISAGYDAAIGCPEGEMKVTPQCYAHMTHLLQVFAEGKVAVFLEGGYNLTSLAEGAALTLRALLDDPVPRLPYTKALPKASLLKTVRNLILRQKPYWKCFSFYSGIPATIYTSPQVYAKKLTVYPTRDAYSKVPQGVEGLHIHLNILETISTNIHSYLRIPPIKLLIAYDETMLKHTSRDGIIPIECPDRIKQSFDLLKSFDLIERAVIVLGSPLENLNILHKVHPETYIQKLTKVIEAENDKQFTSIFTNKHTLECALMAVGSGLNLLDRVMAGDCSSALALIRPPGHHAEPNEAMGFCIFNNVGVAAMHALDHYKLKRVLIVDFDIHHPNGTYSIFKKDNRCLLISIHRYHQNFFPNTGALTEFGEDDGLGYNVNIPWTQKGQGDLEYLTAFLRIILPISRQFDPELVFVSAGFDAAIGDPLGQCNVSPEMYGHMAHMLKEISGGKLLFFLEGGYNVTSVSHSVVMLSKALLGDPIVSISKKSTINDDAAQVINNVIEQQRKYWPILNLESEISTFESNIVGLKNENKTINDTLFSAKIPEQSPCNTIIECQHVDNHLQELPEEGIDIRNSCAQCKFSGIRRYACLSCYYVGCPDQINGHIRHHAFLFGHPLVINFEDLSIYCFSCKRFLSSPNLCEYRNAFQGNKFYSPDSNTK